MSVTKKAPPTVFNPPNSLKQPLMWIVTEQQIANYKSQIVMNVLSSSQQQEYRVCSVQKSKKINNSEICVLLSFFICQNSWRKLELVWNQQIRNSIEIKKLVTSQESSMKKAVCWKIKIFNVNHHSWKNQGSLKTTKIIHNSP